MNGDIFIGIDLGTSVLKACAFDATSGRPVAQAQERLAQDLMKDGKRELRIRHLDMAIVQTVSKLRQTLGSRVKRLQGIGVAAQGGSSIFANRKTGRALTPMVLWNDTRGHEYARRVLARYDTEYWRRLALRDYPPAGLGRLLWFQERHPELFARSNIHIGAGEYLYHQLTGVWRQDPGHAIQIGAYDAKKCRLEQDPFRLLGMPLSFVAPLRQGHENSPLSPLAAATLGLPAGVPVAGPYIDQEAGYLSVAARFERVLQCSLGTAWVGNFVLPKNVSGGSPMQLILPDPTGPGSLVVQPLLTGNAGWDWCRSHILGTDQASSLERAAGVFRQRMLPHEGLSAIPWFTQQNPLIPGAFGSGLFWGVGPQTEPADLLRAVAAGMTFELVRTFGELCRSGIIECVTLGGGASKAKYFRSLIASLFFPVPVYRQVDEDLAAARGSLYAFGGVVSKGRIRPVPGPKSDVRSRIVRAYEHYLSVYERCIQSDSLGTPYRVLASSTELNTGSANSTAGSCRAKLEI